MDYSDVTLGMATEPDEDDQLTRTQRSGRTKRARTRSQTLDAMAALLAAGGRYDEIRIADVAEHAELGAATVHQVFGSKAAIASELFWKGYEPVHLETMRRLLDGSESPATLLVDHLQRLGRYAASNRQECRAFLRAYGRSVLAAGSELGEVGPMERVFEATQSLLNAARWRGEAPEQYSIKGLGTAVTVFLLDLLCQSPPDGATATLDRAISIVTAAFNPPQVPKESISDGSN